MSAEVLTPEQRVERVRMALAEAGYPDATVTWGGANGVGLDDREVPREVGWRAYAVAQEPGLRCWPCWLQQDPFTPAVRCAHDPLTAPWPEVP